MQEEKQLSEKPLQITEQREVKSKGKRERYTQLNAKFQRIAMGDWEAFSSGQHKEIEENTRMRKTRDLFMKISVIKGMFHARIGTIKDTMVRT